MLPFFFRKASAELRESRGPRPSHSPPAKLRESPSHVLVERCEYNAAAAVA
ncbi:MAG: hypothetical protein RL385_5115 [Pseudomonadota bacterium]